MEPGTWLLLSDGRLGHSQQFRVLFAYTHTLFEDKCLTDPEIEGCKALGDASPLAFDLLPVICHGEYAVSTSGGAAQYVGESLGLGTEGGALRSKALMIIIGVEAMRNEVYYPAYNTIMSYRERITGFHMEGYNRWFGHFERYLRTSARQLELQGSDDASATFVGGSQPCYADLVLYDALTAIIDLGCFGRDEAERAVQFPRLCALIEAVEARPELRGYGRPHAAELRAQVGELPPAEAASMACGVWEVIGGADKGGILVRSGKELSSPLQPERLATSALVKELQTEGERLQFEKLTGAGPETGWVSLRGKGGPALLVRTVKRPPVPPMPSVPEKLALPLADDLWRVKYYTPPSRAQQLRLLFRITEVPFEDERLTGEEVEFYKFKFLGDASPLAYDFVPIVQHGGCNICSVGASLQYTAETLGLGWPDDLALRCKCTMLVVVSELMRNELIYPLYIPMVLETKKRFSYCNQEPYQRWFGHFERYFRCAAAAAEAQGNPSGPYFCGQAPCYVDFVLYDCFTMIIDLGCYGRDETERARHFPHICAFIQAVGSHPRLAGYGRPHGDYMRLMAGDLPAPRSPEDDAPAPPARLSRRERLEQERVVAEQALQSFAAGGPEVEAKTVEGMRVVVGDTSLTAEYPRLVQQLVSLINSANQDSLRDAPLRRERYKAIEAEEISERLRDGNLGVHANRVLHVALQGKRAVGCVSSAFSSPGAPLAVGHWELLAVSGETQGQGVASALVAAAMLRLSQECKEVHIEYYHTARHADSERFRSWCETKLGFQTVKSSTKGCPKGTTSVKSRREFTVEETARGRCVSLQHLQSHCVSELSRLAAPGHEEEALAGHRCHYVFGKLETFVRTKASEVGPSINAAFQFDVRDVGVEGKFFVDLRPGLCCAWYGEVPQADCTVRAQDKDLELWLRGELDDAVAFWSGRATAIGPEVHSHTLKYIFREAIVLV